MRSPLQTKPSHTAPEASEPARERIYHYVSQEILLGHFAGGSFIEEEQISSAMNVSRTPVREAFHRLEAERFIDLLPRRGALVRQVTAQELSDLYDTRRVIEGYSIARICQSELAIPVEMTALLKRMVQIKTPRSWVEHVQLDWSFHRAMVAAPGNVVLTDAYCSFRSRQLRVGVAAMTINPNRISRIQIEHQELLKALVAHDEAAARKVLEKHLQLVEDVVSRLPGFVIGAV